MNYLKTSGDFSHHDFHYLYKTLLKCIFSSKRRYMKLFKIPCHYQSNTIWNILKHITHVEIFWQGVTRTNQKWLSHRNCLYFIRITVSLVKSHLTNSTLIPNLPPLCYEAGFNDPWDLIDEGDGPCDVVEDRHITDLLPWHRHVFHQLQYSMGHVLQGSTRGRIGIKNISNLLKICS